MLSGLLGSEARPRSLGRSFESLTVGESDRAEKRVILSGKGMKAQPQWLGVEEPRQGGRVWSGSLHTPATLRALLTPAICHLGPSVSTFRFSHFLRCHILVICESCLCPMKRTQAWRCKDTNRDDVRSSRKDEIVKNSVK